MRILLDECVNPRLRLAFPGDEAKTVAEMGWRSLTNGALMREAASQFDLFLTLDQNVGFQNPVGKQPLGILIVITRFNHIAAYRAQFAEIRDVARKTKPGQISVVQIR
jgi:hypothetical protein